MYWTLVAAVKQISAYYDGKSVACKVCVASVVSGMDVSQCIRILEILAYRALFGGSSGGIIATVSI